MNIERMTRIAVALAAIALSGNALPAEPSRALSQTVGGPVFHYGVAPPGTSDDARRALAPRARCR